jgi:hypothetical protein
MLTAENVGFGPKVIFKSVTQPFISLHPGVPAAGAVMASWIQM